MVPQVHVHCHHLQAGVHPAIWPPVAWDSAGVRNKDAFKFSGKSLWYLQHLKLALQNLSKSTCFSLQNFGAFAVKILGHECSLETSNGNTYYMKQGFPNRSSFGYCLLQKPLLMTGVAAETLGISCGQDSWQQLVADSTDFVHASFHLLLLSLSSMLSQNQDDSHQLPNFSKPHCISSSSFYPPFIADEHWQRPGKSWLW